MGTSALAALQRARDILLEEAQWQRDRGLNGNRYVALAEEINQSIAKLREPVSEEECKRGWIVYMDSRGPVKECMEAAFTDFLARRFGEGK